MTIIVVELLQLLSPQILAIMLQIHPMSEFVIALDSPLYLLHKNCCRTRVNSDIMTVQTVETQDAVTDVQVILRLLSTVSAKRDIVS